MRFSNKRQPQLPPVACGKFLYFCENDIVLKLTCNDIPFPNQNVFFNDKKIGKIDEVLGKLDEVYATVILDDSNIKNKLKLTTKDTLYVTPKFLKKEYLLPREKELDRKEKNEKNTRSKETRNKSNDSYNFKKGIKHKKDKRHNKDRDYRKKSKSNFN